MEEIKPGKSKNEKKRSNRRKLKGIEDEALSEEAAYPDDAMEQTLNAGREQEKQLRITLLDGAESIIRELTRAQQDYDEARFADFTEEELIQYARFQNRIKENMTRVLK